VLKRKMPVELRFYGFFCSTVHLKPSIVMNRIFNAFHCFAALFTHKMAREFPTPHIDVPICRVV